MKNTSEKIARNLHLQFTEMGFAVPGVDDLRAGADVSLRTLYKYYPSREAMIVGALNYRNAEYLDWIAGGPEQGLEHILHPIRRLGDWLRKVANNGCLFQNALAAYPDSIRIKTCVRSHKEQILAEFRARTQFVNPDIDVEMVAASLYLIHEGLTAMAMVHNDVELAHKSALLAAQNLLVQEGIAV